MKIIPKLENLIHEWTISTKQGSQKNHKGDAFSATKEKESHLRLFNYILRSLSTI